ncbi:EAL domain-containing protein [Salinicola corii]|uniref:EAL domain-containing protein n=1 Tax=Salinicola corii TaxID=2606937 RepID=UPI001EF046D9|nr:EAL domain-containing protein [Salinicola corii]
MGMKTALDDFGTRHTNLELLTDISPDMLKIDRQLVSSIDASPRKQIIISHIVALARHLLAKTLEEARWLYRHDIARPQGYWLARPAAERLPVCPGPRFALIKGRY